jgi:hypothetical protein
MCEHQKSCIKGIRVPSLLKCLNPVVLLRSWLPLPPAPFLTMRELRYKIELVLGRCRTESPASQLVAAYRAHQTIQKGFQEQEVRHCYYYYSHHRSLVVASVAVAVSLDSSSVPAVASKSHR